MQNESDKPDMREGKGMVPTLPLQQLMSDTQVLPPSLHDADGPWLLFSHYHAMWHRRAFDGAAAGYTPAIEQAGVFGREKAQQYNDWGMPEGRDEAIPLSRARQALERRLLELDKEREATAAKPSRR